MAPDPVAKRLRRREGFLWDTVEEVVEWLCDRQMDTQEEIFRAKLSSLEVQSATNLQARFLHRSVSTVRGPSMGIVVVSWVNRATQDFRNHFSRGLAHSQFQVYRTWCVGWNIVRWQQLLTATRSHFFQAQACIPQQFLTFQPQQHDNCVMS